jgi:hypothetical protein
LGSILIYEVQDERSFDKQYEEMDWLNKAIEPYTFSLSDTLAKLPSEHVFKYEEILPFIVGDRHMRLEYFCNRLFDEASVSKEQRELFGLVGFERYFKMVIEPGTKIDITEKIIIGRISMVKQKESLDDDEIKEMLPWLNSRHELSISISSAKPGNISVLSDLLECKENSRSRAVNKKARILQTHITRLIHENTWNIKNVDLIIKLLKWIKSYAKNGDAYSLANISKLKCMTHKKNPIYSMEEVV